MIPPPPGLQSRLKTRPDVALLDVIPPPTVCQASPQAYCWGILTANLAALHAAYSCLGSSRVLDRLHGLLVIAHRHLGEYVGEVHPRIAVQLGRVAGAAVLEEMPRLKPGETPIFPGTLEANWWVAASQAATALALWSGIDGIHGPEAEKIGELSRSLRAGIQVMFEDPAGLEILNRILDEDGAPWLEWAAKVYVSAGGKQLV